MMGYVDYVVKKGRRGKGEWRLEEGKRGKKGKGIRHKYRVASSE
jgi:hypothetical protein